MKKHTIYYVYDALCGWCYGFSPVIQELQENFGEEYDFKVLSGGMVTGSRVGPIGQVAGYISEAYQVVEEKTGVKFGEDFLETLEEGTAIFDSEPPALAMALFRNQLPEKQVEFAGRLQEAIYKEGLQPAEWETYAKCAADFGLNGTEFAEKMQHPKLKELVAAEWETVSGWGIQGFPSLILHTGEKAFRLARGFVDYATLEGILKQTETALKQES